MAAKSITHAQKKLLVDNGFAPLPPPAFSAKNASFFLGRLP